MQRSARRQSSNETALSARPLIVSSGVVIGAANLKKSGRMVKLLNTSNLEDSSIVANCLMNRERGCTGGNSYAKELALSPLDFLRARLQTRQSIAWLDLCCGQGRALIEGAQHLAAQIQEKEIVLIGLDLVSMFDPCPNELSFLRFWQESVANWKPECAFDLITCVHGLHYIGDKLKLIQRACSWLKPDGLFIANLDLGNLRLSGKAKTNRKLLRDIKGAGLNYNPKKHLLSCQGSKDISLDYEYLGADDTTGPNYTGQAAVTSYYGLSDGA
jgi:SAM-dependent methyltransferase